jgi:4-hydroxy-tetrahydrodipicolinate synthase
MTASSHRGVHGIWPALVTPLADDGSIDDERFAAHVHSLLAAGCSGVTPFGTTGEGPSFSVAERRAALDALLARGVEGGRVLASVSCAALPDVIELTRHAQDVGCWGILLMPPFFFAHPGDGGIVDAYAQVIEATAGRPLRVVLYNIPQVAGVGVSIGVVGELLRRYPQHIVAIKDSAGDRENSLALAHAYMPGGAGIGVHVGHEPDLPTLGRLGSDGAVSGLANFMPRTVARMVQQPDDPRVSADLQRVERLIQVLRGYSVIPAVKAVHALLSGDAAWRRMRAPLQALDDRQCEALARDLAPLALDPSTD